MSRSRASGDLFCEIVRSRTEAAKETARCLK